MFQSPNRVKPLSNPVLQPARPPLALVFQSPNRVKPLSNHIQGVRIDIDKDVSIAQSRQTSFQLGVLNLQSGKSRYVSIAQSRQTSFQLRVGEACVCAAAQVSIAQSRQTSFQPASI